MPAQHHLSDGFGFFFYWFGVDINGCVPSAEKVSVLNSNSHIKILLWFGKRNVACEFRKKKVIKVHQNHFWTATLLCGNSKSSITVKSYSAIFIRSEKKNEHIFRELFSCHRFGNLISEFINVSQPLKLYTPFRWCRRCFRFFSHIHLNICSRSISHPPPEKNIFAHICIWNFFPSHFRRDYGCIFSMFFSPYSSIIWYLTLNICVNASKQHLHVWSIPGISFASAIWYSLESRQMKEGIQCFDIA